MEVQGRGRIGLIGVTGRGSQDYSSIVVSRHSTARTRGATIPAPSASCLGKELAFSHSLPGSFVSFCIISFALCNKESWVGNAVALPSPPLVKNVRACPQHDWHLSACATNAANNALFEDS